MKVILEKTGSEELSLACFNGGNSHFIMDDSCYVLVNRTTDGKFGMSSWLFPEAVDVLKTLPSEARERYDAVYIEETRKSPYD